MPGKTAIKPSLASMEENIPRIFEQAQVSAANHQKNYVTLNKIHIEAASITRPTDDGTTLQRTGGKLFEDVFIDMVLRVLPLKKGAVVVDRLVKFVAGYAKFITEKYKKESPDGEVEEGGDTPATRFTGRLLNYLLKGFEAKEKNVRFRVLQLTAEVVANVGTTGDDLFEHLRVSLLQRAHDKEPQVRAQAIVALARIAPLEDNENLREEIIDVLIDSLIRDPSSEARKHALLHIPIGPVTLSSILTRVRDPDPVIRKMVYENILIENLEHPKQLSIAQREAVVRSGLRDREPNVRAAAAKLISDWVDKVEGDIEAFVGLFDFDHIESPEWAVGDDIAFAPAEAALLCALGKRGDITDNLQFDDTYWQDLTPVKAFIARVFVDHCLNVKDEARVEANMPVMTALAFKIQALYNELLRRSEADTERQFFEDVKSLASEDKNDDLVFVMGELLKLAVSMDSGDEIGRRRLFALVKDMASQDTLPERLLPNCLDILRKLSSGERDLIRIVVEIVHDLRDVDKEEDDLRGRSVDTSGSIEDTPMVLKTPRPPKPQAEMTPEEMEHAILIDMRCLSLCTGMLERVNSSFEENSTLEGVLGELILPAVKSKEPALREKGLVCLGLCCLIARRMALNSLELFLKQIQPSSESLRVRVVQIVFDIMMVHEGDLLADTTVGGHGVVEFLRRVFESEESPQVQAVLCTGLSKLMLSGMVTDEKVIKTLIKAYLSPDTADNQHIRQCLSYFFPVYCYSSVPNQRRLQKIFMEIYMELSQMTHDLDDGQDMVSPLQAATLLVDWTDPQKVIEGRGQTADKYVHFDIAVEIVKVLFDKDLDKDDKKVLCQILSRLYMPEDIDDYKIRTLKLLVNNITTRRPLRDTTAKNAFARFDGAISKKYAVQLESFNEEEYRELEELQDLFVFLDDIIPLDSDEEVDVPKRGAKKRRSESISTTATATTADEGDFQVTPERRTSAKGKGKGRSKKRRLSKSSDEDTSDNDENEDTTPPAAPTRTMPRRAATKAVKVIEPVPDSELSEDRDSSQEGDDSDSVADADASPPPRPSKMGTQKNKMTPKRKPRTTEERRLDDSIDALLASDSASGDGGEDSILDAASTKSDDEDEDEAAGEVDDLL